MKERGMPIGVIFEVPDASAEEYDAVMAQLAHRNADPPERLCHVAGPSQDGWVVVDIWESREAFEAFLTEHLLPVARNVGFFASLPTSFRVHRLITVAGSGMGND